MGKIIGVIGDNLADVVYTVARVLANAEHSVIIVNPEYNPETNYCIPTRDRKSKSCDVRGVSYIHQYEADLETLKYEYVLVYLAGKKTKDFIAECDAFIVCTNLLPSNSLRCVQEKIKTDKPVFCFCRASERFKRLAEKIFQSIIVTTAKMTIAYTATDYNKYTRNLMKLQNDYEISLSSLNELKNAIYPLFSKECSMKQFKRLWK